MTREATTARATRDAPRGTHAARDSPGAIFVRFLKFGALAWGGPAAQIAMIKRECVDQEGWVSEETFKQTLAVYQVLPGPEAHELCVYFGRLRGGKLGGLLAGLGFMLPGFLLMLGLSILYVEVDIADSLDELYSRAARAQQHEPVPLMEEAGRRWWWYRDRFYWEDEGCAPFDVVALVADRERRRQRRLERAHAALHQEHPSNHRREPLPRELRLAVWRRDRGRCRECGDGFDLQYDHVIPLALGGATSVDNLQLLCGDCNRAKGASL
jgi:5-methylcytosine-specific restriction endonuclease McrA